MDWQKFFDKIFKDVLELLTETRDYIKWQEPIDAALLKYDVDRKYLNCETAKMSVYLINIVTWLLARQAVMNGEIHNEHADKYLCEKPLTFWVETGFVPKFMPERVTILSRKILNMYDRINRLSTMTKAVEECGRNS